MSLLQPAEKSSPVTAFAEIPSAVEILHSVKTVNKYHPASCKTVHFSNTYFQNELFEWNALTIGVHE